MQCLLRTLMICLAVATAAREVSPAAQTGGPQAIDFPTSGAPAAQRYFREGVFLLHSFEYNDARDAFRMAQKIDPGYALSYWGEAMTHNQPLWFTQDRDAALAALMRLAPTAAERLRKAPTAREKAYVAAVEVLFGDGDKQKRDVAYAEAMRRLSEQYPGDLEAASLHALAILGTSHRGRDGALYMRAAAILEKLFAKKPGHPGVAHYLIHCYDDPPHAKLGLAAARVYAAIAPAAPHAQHMPSHIFLALGMWDETAASNEAAWAASDARLKRKGLAIQFRDYHSLWWLQYAYLQQGRYRQARRMLATIEAAAAKTDSDRVRWHLAVMRAAQVIETRQWSSVSEIKLDFARLSRVAGATELFVTALSALKTGSLSSAEEIVGDANPPATAQGVNEGAHEHGGESGDAAIVTVMERELRALIRMAKGDSSGGLALMKEAAGTQITTSFEFGPPLPVKPAHELFGEMLLEMKRPAEARAEFERSLVDAPRRALSLLGLARAAAAAGDDAASRKAYRELLAVWRSADPEMPELAEAKEALGRAGGRDR